MARLLEAVKALLLRARGIDRRIARRELLHRVRRGDVRIAAQV